MPALILTASFGGCNGFLVFELKICSHKDLRWHEKNSDLQRVIYLMAVP